MKYRWVLPWCQMSPRKVAEGREFSVYTGAGADTFTASNHAGEGQ